MDGFGDKDPLLEHEEKDDEDDDDENGDETTSFQPGGASTPGEDIPLTTMNRGKEKEPSTAETSFIEVSPISRVLTSNEKAWDSLTGIYPEARAIELKASYSKTGRLEVKMFGQGKKVFLVYKRQKNRRRKVKPRTPKRNKICPWSRE